MCRTQGRLCRDVHRGEHAQPLYIAFSYRYQIRLGDYLYVLPSSLNKGFQGIETGLTEPPQCMPDYCKIEDDAIMGYRNYYIREKSYMARWNFTPEPIWYTIGMAAEAA